MQVKKLFSQALGVVDPWKITSLKFDSSIKRLDIEVDFEPGTLFEYENAATGEKDSLRLMIQLVSLGDILIFLSMHVI